MVDTKNELLEAIKNEMEYYNSYINCEDEAINICDCLIILNQHLGDERNYLILSNLTDMPWAVSVHKDDFYEAIIYIRVDKTDSYYYKILIYYEVNNNEDYWFTPTFEVIKVTRYAKYQFEGTRDDLLTYKREYENNLKK